MPSLLNLNFLSASENVRQINVMSGVNFKWIIILCCISGIRNGSFGIARQPNQCMDG